MHSDRDSCISITEPFGSVHVVPLLEMIPSNLAQEDDLSSYLLSSELLVEYGAMLRCISILDMCPTTHVVAKIPVKLSFKLQLEMLIYG
jgi:hypothetical protein